MHKKIIIALLAVIAATAVYPYAKSAYYEVQYSMIVSENNANLQKARDRAAACNLPYHERPDDCSIAQSAAAEAHLERLEHHKRMHPRSY